MGDFDWGSGWAWPGSAVRVMTYWTDAAVLGEAGIPSVIFGPGGSGYHGLEEYVKVDEVLICRDALIHLARSFCTNL